MPALTTTLDTWSTGYRGNRSAMLRRLDELTHALRQARAAGGERVVTRHHARDRLLARERVELLVDRDSPLLELSPTAAWGTGYPVGAAAVTALGIVEGHPCVIIANEPTLRGGAVNQYTVRKVRRAIALACREDLPVVNLADSVGPDLPEGHEPAFPGDPVRGDLARLAANQAITVTVVFSGAVVPGTTAAPDLSDVTIIVRTPVESNASSAPPCDLTPADLVANDEWEAINLARQAVRRAGTPAPWPAPNLSRTAGARPDLDVPSPGAPAILGAPTRDPDELLGVVPLEPDEPVGAREVLLRILDDSYLDEFRPGYASSLSAGWASIHGYPLAVVADPGPAADPASARRLAQFIRFVNASGVPLLILDGTGSRTPGTDVAEAAADGKHRSGRYAGPGTTDLLMTCQTPIVALQVGPTRGFAPTAGSMATATPTDPASDIAAFRFRWPTGRLDTGDDRQAEVSLRVARQRAETDGQPFDEAEAAAVQASLARRREHESTALFRSGMVEDDGIIDPRDTRTTLGLCLAVLACGGGRPTATVPCARGARGPQGAHQVEAPPRGACRAEPTSASATTTSAASARMVPGTRRESR